MSLWAGQRSNGYSLSDYALGRPSVTSTQTLIRLIIGLGMTLIVAGFAARRVWWLFKLIMSGQPASGRTNDVGTRIWTQIAEVFGQRKLLKWSIPGLAHFFTMWGFIILHTVYIEA